MPTQTASIRYKNKEISIVNWILKVEFICFTDPTFQDFDTSVIFSRHRGLFSTNPVKHDCGTINGMNQLKNLHIRLSSFVKIDKIWVEYRSMISDSVLAFLTLCTDMNEWMKRWTNGFNIRTIIYLVELHMYLSLVLVPWEVVYIHTCGLTTTSVVNKNRSMWCLSTVSF